MAGSDGAAPRFDRVFFGSGPGFTRIGDGEVGGKAKGLLATQGLLERQLDRFQHSGIRIGIPTMTVLTTQLFDAFMERNHLHETAFSDLPAERIAHAFQKADLPVELLGDLRALVEEVRSPLAIRSSSLLEDALYRPFAGVYGTKMIPNNQADPNARFRTLLDAIKYVYASTFFPDAKAYLASTDRTGSEERMAVLIQEVVGERHFDRFYPEISGVARSYNFYPIGSAPREQGVVSLALGLGKTIVDGGVTWSYSPGRPEAPPPFASARDVLQKTQTEFWAVNMDAAPEYDPVRETEYLVRSGISEADLDGTLRYVASTYLAASDRMVPGIGTQGPRAVDFAPLLQLREWPLNELIRELLLVCEEGLETPVEIEFAASFEPQTTPRFALLQVRPLVVPSTEVLVSAEEMEDVGVFVASDQVLGNGILETIRDIVYMKPEDFDPARNLEIAKQAETLNLQLREQGRHYLLLGFGRWGSSDSWLGSPVTWGQISNARVIVEVSLPSLPGDLSQGSHFFHNVTSFEIPYFMVRHQSIGRIDWDWLSQLPASAESEHLRHVSLAAPFLVKADGRTGRGIVRRPDEG